MEKKAEQTTEKIQARQVEAVVEQRVAEELERLQQEQAQLKEKFEVAVSDNVPTAVNTDIQAMVDRITR